MVDAVDPKGHQIADIEGITLVDAGAGNGLLIASSQGQGNEKSYFSIFDRKTGAYRSAFRIVDGPKADGCSHTDGVAATVVRSVRLPQRCLHLPGRRQHDARRGRQPGLQADRAGEDPAVAGMTLAVSADASG